MLASLARAPLSRALSSLSSLPTAYCFQICVQQNYYVYTVKLSLLFCTAKKKIAAHSFCFVCSKISQNVSRLVYLLYTASRTLCLAAGWCGGWVVWRLRDAYELENVTENIANGTRTSCVVDSSI